MPLPTARLAALAVLAAVAPASAAAQDPGFMVLATPAPPVVLQPGPGAWMGAEPQAGQLELRDLAAGLPRARLRVGGRVVVRLPFAAAAATVTVLRPRALRADGTGLVVSRTRLRALLDGDTVVFRMSGTAGVVVVYAVDAAGRGTASGRVLARLADAPSCRAWTRQVRRIGDPDSPRAAALRTLLRHRCVSPFGLPRPDGD